MNAFWVSGGLFWWCMALVVYGLLVCSDFVYNGQEDLSGEELRWCLTIWWIVLLRELEHVSEALFIDAYPLMYV
jgi:hypothetical protein